MLAALHFNENEGRRQAKDKEGKPIYNLSYKKAKQDFSVQEVKVEPTFGKLSVVSSICGLMLSLCICLFFI